MWLVRKVKKLLSIPQNFTTWEKRERYIIEYLKQWNNKLQEDELWNLYIIQKWMPLVCAHMDTRQEFKDCTKIDTIKLKNWVIRWDKCIIWWDDKVWIAMAMQAREETQWKISLLFTVNEERWMTWSSHFHRKYNELLREAPYCIIPDRMWGADFIWTKNDYCSHEFENDALQIMWQFWYKSVRWFCCDANVLSDSINCFNMSCWYYWHHTENEHINIDEMEMAYRAMITLIWDLEIKQWPLYTKPVTTNWNNYKYNHRWNKNKNNNQWHLWSWQICHSCTIIWDRLHVTADTEVYNEETWEVIYLPVWKYILNDLIQNYGEEKKEWTMLSLWDKLPFSRFQSGYNRWDWEWPKDDDDYYPYWYGRMH